jgi:prepilin-type processing-associated H-X9-DG protein
LSKAKTKAQGIACMNNLRQLQLGWVLFSGDNAEQLVPNGDVGTQPAALNDPNASPDGSKAQWCPGDVNVANTPLADGRLTQEAWIELGVLWPYTKSLGVYKCPADHRMADPVHSTGGLTSRSISMNAFLNPLNPSWSGFSGNYRLFKKQSDILAPADIWVTIDESPQSINDAFFVANPDLPTTWTDFPATYHNQAGGLSFADGHVQIKKWRDAKLLYYNTLNVANDNGKMGQPPDFTDVHWLQDRTTVKN